MWSRNWIWGEQIGLFRQVYSVHFVKSFDKLDENHDVDLVIYTCIESKPSRSKSSHTVNPILLDKKYLSANTQCWISIYFNEIFIRHLPHRNNSASTLIQLIESPCLLVRPSVTKFQPHHRYMHH